MTESKELYAVRFGEVWSISEKVKASEYGLEPAEQDVWSEQGTTALVGIVGKEDAALALLTPSDGVKALEWEHRAAIPDKLYERWRAFSLIGEYRIDKTEKGFEWYGPNTEMFCRETLDQAKADAHADFKARILSALTPGKE